MRKELRNANDRPKMTYQIPRIEFIILEMEQGIASGSASVGSKSPTNDFIQEWNTADDRESAIDWGKNYMMKTALKSKENRKGGQNRFILSMLFLIGVFAIFSCKNADNGENAIPAGATTVKVNIMEMSFGGELSIGNLNNKATAGGGRNNLITQVQRSTLSLNSDYNIVAELTTEIPSVNNNASTAAIKANGKKGALVKDVMRLGVRYKMVVFDQIGNYITEQDYIRGQEDSVSDLTLNGDQTYTFIVYSVNSISELPSIIFDNNVKTTNTARLLINGNMDFSYGQQMKTLAKGQNNPVNVYLRHKLSQITTIVDATALGYNITAISSSIDSHQPQAIVALNNGMITQNGAKGNININFPSLNAPRIVSTPTLVNANTNNASYTIQSITIGSVVASNIIGFKDFKITPGIKYNMRLSIVSKDGYLTHEGMPAVRINGQIWMRHNLGADLNYEANGNGPKLFGNYYQFGRNVIVASGMDEKVNNLWSNNYAIENYPWNANYGGNGDDEAILKGPQDPCPEGYRIPTDKEAEELISNTIQSNTGLWNGDLKNYFAMKILTSKNNSKTKITFPVQGWFPALGANINESKSNTIQLRAHTVALHTNSGSRLNPIFSGRFIMRADQIRVATENNPIGLLSSLNIRCIASPIAVQPLE